MNFRHGKILFAFAACVLCFCMIAAEHSRQESYDFPPLIFVGGCYYKHIGTRAKKPDDCVEIGTVEHVVTMTERPEKEFEANDENLLGKMIYERENELYLRKDDVWLLFEKLEEDNHEKED